MSSVTIRIPTPLRGYTNGAGEVHVEGDTVGDVLDAMGDRHSGLLERVLSEDGTIRQFVTVYKGSDDVRNLDGLQTPLADGDVLAIIPAVAGGIR